MMIVSRYDFGAAALVELRPEDFTAAPRISPENLWFYDMNRISSGHLIGQNIQRPHLRLVLVVKLKTELIRERR